MQRRRICNVRLVFRVTYKTCDVRLVFIDWVTQSLHLHVHAVSKEAHEQFVRQKVSEFIIIMGPVPMTFFKGPKINQIKG